MLLTLSAVLGCSRPQEQYIFERSDQGEYHFSLDFGEPEALYDISFYTRMEGKDLHLYEAKEMPMHIVAESPSGKRYSEDFNFTVIASDMGKMHLKRKDVYVPYRIGISPSEPGFWKMTVYTEYNSGLVTGLGVYVKRREK